MEKPSNMGGKVIAASKAGADGILLGESTYLAIRQAILSCSVRPGRKMSKKCSRCG
jgi:hypothetical protein